MDASQEDADGAWGDGGPQGLGVAPTGGGGKVRGACRVKNVTIDNKITLQSYLYFLTAMKKTQRESYVARNKIPDIRCFRKRKGIERR